MTDGTYHIGGRPVGTNLVSNRVAVDKALTVRSVNGPQFTVIQGYEVPGITNGDGAIRCVYLAYGASLSGFTLTKGATGAADRYRYPSDSRHASEVSGGGAWCESATVVISNCVVAGNSASYGGGGTYRGTLNSCTLTGNSVPGQGFLGGDTYSGASFGGTLHLEWQLGRSGRWGGGDDLNSCTLNNCALSGDPGSLGGGGAYDCTINNCTLTGNSASSLGGGAWNCTLNNCIVYYNTAMQGANCSGCTVNYSCTTPDLGGIGNISSDPQLVSRWHLS